MPLLHLASPQSNHESAAPPFVLELRAEEFTRGGFTPSAALLLTPALRRSGLLADLPADELATLLAALCCLTPNGSFVATPELVGQALGLPSHQARERLRRLARRRWHEAPLLNEQATPSGLRLFLPSSALFALRHSAVLPYEAYEAGKGLPPAYPPGTLGDSGTLRGGFREQIIAHSRAAYARPRAEVEAEINRFLGYRSKEEELQEARGALEKAWQDAPATPAEAERRALLLRLLEVGLALEQAEALVQAYPPELVGKQLAWLPYRRPRNPAGLLLAAIERDYEPPLGLPPELGLPTELMSAEEDVDLQTTGENQATATASDENTIGGANEETELGDSGETVSLAMPTASEEPAVDDAVEDAVTGQTDPTNSNPANQRPR
jgi:hypothetical protein